MILFWICVSVMVLLGLALVTPALFRVYLTNSPHFAYRVEMRAMAGLAPCLILARGPQQGVKAKQKTEPAKPGRRRSFPNHQIRGALIRALPRLAGDILRQIHLSELHIDADYGLGDPADTGELSGLLMTLQYSNPLPASCSLNMRPDFTRPRLEGSLTTSLRLTVAAFLIPALRFAWTVFGPRR